MTIEQARVQSPQINDFMTDKLWYILVLCSNKNWISKSSISTTNTSEFMVDFLFAWDVASFIYGYVLSADLGTFINRTSGATKLLQNDLKIWACQTRTPYQIQFSHDIIEMWTEKNHFFYLWHSLFLVFGNSVHWFSLTLQLHSYILDVYNC